MAAKQNGKKQQMTGDWLYFCPAEIGVRELHDVLSTEYETEIWEDAGVLEISIPEAGSVDVEELIELDEFLEAYMAERELKTVFAVTLKPDEYEKAKLVMEKIKDTIGGYFCGDTDDFQPEFK